MNPEQYERRAELITTQHYKRPLTPEEISELEALERLCEAADAEEHHRNMEYLRGFLKEDSPMPDPTLIERLEELKEKWTTLSARFAHSSESRASANEVLALIGLVRLHEFNEWPHEQWATLRSDYIRTLGVGGRG